MSDEARRERSRQWIEAAYDDLLAAQTLQQAGLYAQSCFFAQQAAEKAMKGFLSIRQSAPHGHSLATLLKNLPPDESLLALEPSRLDRFYIGTRYPDALPEGSDIRSAYTRRDAEDAHTTASGVVDLLSGWARALEVPVRPPPH
ncbi:hypothetical protein C4901_10285 [Acidiferrobacter sp. SPIII_3]|jgi:HEPN domain-containing protein|uniref:HEPN domain-containing protein n=1 Tax=Acidiferrobacter sp. SPIII_3 TaxID=1281578 RepID=UPI000D725A53|nr:HEPN domain-containing protein [Acidiferrobacter sp. SPIII_3]AWP23666.1 hypothetical protein C4901_10285 [Acidiferrobacter sp. SPIII_3]